jgi:DNA-binding transcriptional regulator LsrR (DeoR family)
VQYLDLIDPQALQELQAEFGLGRDEIQDWLQVFMDDMQQEIAMGASIIFEVVSTELQNGRAETLVTITASHPLHGDDEFTDTIATVERDGRWYLEELRW